VTRALLVDVDLGTMVRPPFVYLKYPLINTGKNVEPWLFVYYSPCLSTINAKKEKDKKSK
jgi:hypothetical protein